MKIMFNLKPPESSYGGGAFFVKNLTTFLNSNNVETTYELDNNIDIIFIIDPRKGTYKRYGLDEIINYKRINPSVKIIYRVNECDIKREVSINLEPLLVRTMVIADRVVFVSEWLKNYFINKYNTLQLEHKSSYVLNGVNANYFNFNKETRLNTNLNLGPIKLITHHWSNNYLKGFEIYNKLDQLLDNDKYKNVFELTYIGNYYTNYYPKNIKRLPPMSGQELANELKKHHIYLTATQNEPGAMHYLEGASCGLPVLYRTNGGGANEICSKFGEQYDTISDLFTKINKIVNNYKDYIDKIDTEYLKSERCSKEYFNTINDLF